MPSIQIGFSCAPLVVVLLFFLSFAIAFFYYHRTLPVVTRGKRFVLAFLRGLTLFLLLLLLCNPVVHLTHSTSQPPTVAILIDQSASMRLTDRTGDRAQQLRAALSAAPLQQLAGKATVKYYRFGTSLEPLSASGVDSLSLDHQGTDISAALQQLVTQDRDKEIQAALLFTDGVSTRGANPVHIAEQLPYPLYAVGIGDSTEQKDVVITRLVTNAAVYSGVSVPVDVTVKSTGYENQQLEVSLLEGTTVRDRKSLTVGHGSREYPVQLFYTPEGEGLKQYTVRVSSLPDEITTRNNRRTFFARIRKSKLLVLMISGEPSSDVSIIRQTLTENPNYTVRSFTQRGSTAFFEGTFSSSLFDSADCVVLVNMPTSATPAELINRLQKACVDGTKPLLFISGRHVDYRRLSSLSTILPFTTDITSTAEYEVFLAPTPAEATHPLLTLNDAQPAPAWEKLPPVLRTRTLLRPKLEAHVLATVKQQNVVLPDPLIITRNIQRRKTLALLCYDIWRWRLMAQGSPETASVLAGFLSTAVNWLTTPEEARPLIVTPIRDAFAQGESVEFQGQAYDQTMRPLDNAQVTVRVRQDTSVVETILRSTGNGRYEGSVAALAEGIHTYRAAATVNGTTIGADSGKFSVGAMDEEFLDTRMNMQLLRAITERTGGSAYVPSEIERLATSLEGHGSFSSRVITSSSTTEMRSWPYLAASVILLLAIEWLIRKRSGML